MSDVTGWSRLSSQEVQAPNVPKGRHCKPGRLAYW